jgi:hypothetical protein
MSDIQSIDLAWEWVNAVGEASRKALLVIEQMGGRGPDARPSGPLSPERLRESESNDQPALFPEHQKPNA